MTRTLNERTEIATTINFKRMPIVRIDLSQKDDYGLKGTKVLINAGTFRDGNPHYIEATLRSYEDEIGLTFSSYGCMLTASFGYYEIEKMLEYANAPIIEKDQDICVVYVNSDTKVAYPPQILHTGSHIDPHCATPLTIEREFIPEVTIKREA